MSSVGADSAARKTFGVVDTDWFYTELNSDSEPTVLALHVLDAVRKAGLRYGFEKINPSDHKGEIVFGDEGNGKIRFDSNMKRQDVDMSARMTRPSWKMI